MNEIKQGTALDALRIPEFRRLWIGQILSAVGSAMLMLAVLVHVYAVTGSTRMATLAFVVETAPLLLFSPFAGVLADRVDRRVLVIGADLSRALLLVPLALDSRIAILLPTLAVQASLDALFRPAFGAMLPAKVGQENVVAANGLMNTTYASLGIFVPALGTALYAHHGLQLLVLLDIASFALSALMTATLSSAPPQAVAVAEADLAAPLAAIKEDLRVGARAIWSHPLLRVVVLAECTLSLTEGILKPMFVPFVFGTLHGDPSKVGVAATAQGIGGVVAGLLVAVVAHRVRPSRMAVYGLQGFALVIAVMAIAPTFAIALGAMFCLGLPGTLSMVGLDSSVQLHADQSQMGRVLGAKATMTSLFVLVAALVPATLSSWLGVRGVIGLAAGVLAVTAIVLARAERNGSAEPVAADVDTGGTAVTAAAAVVEPGLSAARG